MAAVKFNDVWELYRIKFVMDGKASCEDFWALKGVSFKIEKGESLGIIGENGAGKSTILKLISGVLKPDRGGIEVGGKVSGLLELGAGFQPELTGEDNIYFNAGLFGLERSKVKERYEEIIDFADIGKFIHAPVKYYSQGMFVRLAFAIAVHMDSDILLIDDTLAVGDEHFQRKCIKKIFEIKEQGKTIVFVTHDIGMLNRICHRAIFLKDGKIAQDGNVDKVISLYSQTIGKRSGVSVIEKGPLKIVFNNGRFFINWEGMLLTPSSGAYTTFCIADRWYNSLQADWEIVDQSGAQLTVRGNFYQLAVDQVWCLELTGGHALKWDVTMESREPFLIQQGHTNIMLTSKYGKWFSSLGSGEFPDISHKDKDWQGLLEESPLVRCIGVESGINCGGGLPTLSFETAGSNSVSCAQVLNSNYLGNSRILQYKSFELQNYAAVSSGDCIYFSGRVVIGIPDTHSYLKGINDEFIISRGKIKIVFNKGKAILSYNNINLTKASHIATLAVIDGKQYLSTAAVWHLRKEGEDKLVVDGHWPGLPIVQTWEIAINNGSSFSWKIKMRIDGEVCIEEQYAWLRASDKYANWFCDYGEGSFPAKFLENDVDMLQRCIPEGAIGVNDSSGILPMINLNFIKEADNFAKIINSDFYHKARILRVDKIYPERERKFFPGEYACFEIGVSLEENGQDFIKPQINAIGRERAKFIFEQGKGRIYWEGRELTKRLGFYTALRCNGRWHDSSSSAVWKIVDNRNGTIKVHGKWFHIPVQQTWEIAYIKDNLFRFSVNMKLEELIVFDRLQANLMLSESYACWFTDKEDNIFPVFSDNIDDDWESVWREEEPGSCIGVPERKTGKEYLPSIRISPQRISPDWRMHILNSDISHRGRVLQYLKAGETRMPAGDYPYFAGSIIIGE